MFDTERCEKKRHYFSHEYPIFWGLFNSIHSKENNPVFLWYSGYYLPICFNASLCVKGLKGCARTKFRTFSG